MMKYFKIRIFPHSSLMTCGNMQTNAFSQCFYNRAVLGENAVSEIFIKTEHVTFLNVIELADGQKIVLYTFIKNEYAEEDFEIHALCVEQMGVLNFDIKTNCRTLRFYLKWQHRTYIYIVYTCIFFLLIIH